MIKRKTAADPISQSADIVQDNLTQLQQLFPSVFTEGNIDFEALRELLGDKIETDPEYYRFTWPGKAMAKAEARKTSRGTLRPAPQESVKKDGKPYKKEETFSSSSSNSSDSDNLYIEGDNLEVLKLLQKSYAGKIKMIYIDPPYNTGKDFVYKDNYKDNLDNYNEKFNRTDDDGNLKSSASETNQEGSARYHSNWLNMMYPRLMLARNLMTEDGVIFISIDDNEVENLRKICNEIYGEDNCLIEIVREAIRGGSQSKNIRVVHDYVLVFAKNLNQLDFTGVEVDGFILNEKDEFGPFRKGRELNKWGAGSRREDSPGMFFSIQGPNDEKVYPIRNDGSDGRWRLGKDKMKKLVEEKNIIFEKREDDTYIAYEKLRDDSPRIKQFTTLFKKNYVNSKGSQRIKNLFNISTSYFSYAKPIELIYDLLIMNNCTEDDIILDFFSGSSTTADSVINYSLDFESLKFIMVQLPEQFGEDDNARKDDYDTIPEVAKERIRLAGTKILEENPRIKGKLDVGFKVFKLDESNLKTWETDPENLEANLLTEDVIKEDRSTQDVLYEILLKYGLDLTVPIVEKTVSSSAVENTLYAVGAGALLVCLDDTINSNTAQHLIDWATELEAINPQVVFKDSGFAGSEDKINTYQLLKGAGMVDVWSI